MESWKWIKTRITAGAKAAKDSGFVSEDQGAMASAMAGAAAASSTIASLLDRIESWFD